MGNRARRDRVEPTTPPLAGLVVTLALYATLPGDLADIRHVVTTLAVLAAIPLVVLNPVRFDRQERWSRRLWLALTAVLTAAVLVAFGETVVALLVDVTPRLVIAAVQAWLAGIGAFALLYWQLDRSGPFARQHTELPHRRPDLRFPEEHHLGALRGHAWTARFGDYLRVSLRVAVAFLPSAATAISTRARRLVALQAFAGFVVLATAAARALVVLLWSP